MTPVSFASKDAIVLREQFLTLSRTFQRPKLDDGEGRSEQRSKQEWNHGTNHVSRSADVLYKRRKRETERFKLKVLSCGVAFYLSPFGARRRYANSPRCLPDRNPSLRDVPHCTPRAANLVRTTKQNRATLLSCIIWVPQHRILHITAQCTFLSYAHPLYRTGAYGVRDLLCTARSSSGTG